MSTDGRGRRQDENTIRSDGSATDGRYNPESLFEVIASSDSAEQASEAMRVFIQKGDGAALEQAIAIYARAAKARGQKIENILAELNKISHDQHERYSHDGELLKPTQLKKLVLRTVLEAFET
jgi:hypothetical protein